VGDDIPLLAGPSRPQSAALFIALAWM